MKFIKPLLYPFIFSLYFGIFGWFFKWDDIYITSILCVLIWLPVIYLHLTHFFYSRGKSVEIIEGEGKLLIIQKSKTRIILEKEIKEIKYSSLVLSWWIPFYGYKYSIMCLNSGEKIILTSWMGKDIYKLNVSCDFFNVFFPELPE